MDAVAAKICSVCGIDCSAMKRAKDANGRYICSECLERAREAKVAKEGKPVVVATGPVVPKKVSAPAPAMLPNGVDPILDNLVAASKSQNQVACTQCAYPMDREAKICTHCGLNTLSGKVTRTAVHRAPKDTGDDGKLKKARANPALYYSASLVGGALAAAVGIYLWSQVLETAEITPNGFQLGRSIKYVSAGVGLLCGTGTYIGAQGFSNVLTGIYAAILTFFAVMVGRYVGIATVLNTHEIGGFFDVLPDLFAFGDILWLPVAMLFGFKIGSSGFERSF